MPQSIESISMVTGFATARYFLFIPLYFGFYSTLLGEHEALPVTNKYVPNPLLGTLF